METTRKGLSAAVLKNIAVITMTIDHVTAFLLKAYLYQQGNLNVYSNDWYVLGRVIGRIAFVLYAFMIAEGALKTRNKIKYAGRLLALAVISVVPYSYVNTGRVLDFETQNIFFLLFLGLITLYAWEWLERRIGSKILSMALRILAAAAACAISEVLHFEYGMMGILLILVFYLWRYEFPKLALAGALVMTVGYIAHVLVMNGAVNWISRHSATLINDLMRTDRIQVFGLLAFPLIFLYNGKKGRQLPKMFYYLFYPVHLGIIALILYL
ncbi:MAG: hypothetical protein IJ106_05355 [Parasporobacterium sp.]|nr:hypothetical protein [Parasporobacterium sp.]